MKSLDSQHYLNHGAVARLTVTLIIGFAGTVMSGSSFGGDEGKKFVLDTEFIAKSVESKIRLPKEAFALATYKRYYALQHTAAGTEDIVGTFVHDPATPGVLIVEIDELPRILDGGCSVIEVRYSLTSRRLLSARCNGVG